MACAASQLENALSKLNNLLFKHWVHNAWNETNAKTFIKGNNMVSTYVYTHGIDLMQSHTCE